MKFMRIGRKNSVVPEEAVVPVSPNRNHSLGCGSIKEGQVEYFVATPVKMLLLPPRTLHERGIQLFKKPVVFQRLQSSFLRVADLKMDSTASIASVSSDGGEGICHFHYSSAQPPPGMEEDPKERWVALDDGDGMHGPLAPLAVDALCEAGQEGVWHESMWTSDHKTAKLLHKPSWQSCIGEPTGPALVDPTIDREVLVWSGTFSHGGYGCELPAVRAAGVIDMPAVELMNLLMDSNRVKVYNKLSQGRTDLLVLQDNMDSAGPFGGLTKVCRSESRPPLLRKTLQFTSLLHARALPDGSYCMVTRAVTAPADDAGGHALVSEILMGVNIIRPINDKACLMVTVNHIRSPMVPMMIAKRIGLQAAVNFFHDLRVGC